MDDTAGSAGSAARPDRTSHRKVGPRRSDLLLGHPLGAGTDVARGYLVVRGDGTIEVCHRSFAFLAGRPSEELVDHPVEDVLATDDRDPLLSTAQPVRRFAARVQRPDGDLPVTVREYLRPSAAATTDPSWVIVAEEADASGAAPAAAAKDDPEPSDGSGRSPAAELQAAFLRAVAHDLKNPLSIITGMGHTLAERRADIPEDVQRELAEAIARQGGRLLATLENLLALDRLALGRTRLRREALDVRDVVEDVIASLTDEGADVRTDCEPITAPVDRALFERIVENLVRNAIEHQQHRHVVDVRLRRSRENLGCFELVVLDRGPGIPPEERDQIFRPYFRGDRRGVGLSIVRAFARLHGGDVAVTDRAGGGSAFVVSLPIGSARP